MKAVIYLLVCTFIANSYTQNIFDGDRIPSDAENTLQLLNNGWFEQVGLPDPATILNCYDENSAELTVTFIGTVLEQLANNDVFGVQSTVKTFEKEAPQSVKDCLAKNAEFQQVQQKYNIAGLTLSQMQSKVAVYAFAHLTQVHIQSVAANSDFKAGNYVKVGKEGGALAQQIFGSSTFQGSSLPSKVVVDINDFIVSSLDDDPMRDLHEVFAGFWQQASLPDPTTPIYCFNATSAKTALDLFGKLLRQYANDEFVGVSKTFDEFETEIPQNVSQCFLADSQVVQVEAKYGISGLLPEAFEKIVAKYAMAHYSDFHKNASQLNQEFQTHKYQSVGSGSGRALLTILKD